MVEQARKMRLIGLGPFPPSASWPGLAARRRQARRGGRESSSPRLHSRDFSTRVDVQTAVNMLYALMPAHIERANGAGLTGGSAETSPPAQVSCSDSSQLLDSALSSLLHQLTAHPTLSWFPVLQYSLLLLQASPVAPPTQLHLEAASPSSSSSRCSFLL